MIGISFLGIVHEYEVRDLGQSSLQNSGSVRGQNLGSGSFKKVSQVRSPWLAAPFARIARFLASMSTEHGGVFSQAGKDMAASWLEFVVCDAVPM